MGCTITFCTFWPWPRYAMLDTHKHHTTPHSLSESNFRNNEPEAEVRLLRQRRGRFLGNTSLATGVGYFGAPKPPGEAARRQLPF